MEIFLHSGGKICVIMIVNDNAIAPILHEQAPITIKRKNRENSVQKVRLKRQAAALGKSCQGCGTATERFS